jgi:hypothetical protein
VGYHWTQVAHLFTIVNKKLPGGIPLKLTSLLVIALLVVLGSSTAVFAQGSFTLGFTSSADEGEYCNFEQIQYGPGSENNFYMQGIDNIQAACFSPNQATVEGVKVSITPGDGSLVSGPAYGYADNIYDAFSGGFTGFQWFVLTQTRPSTRLKKYGWAGYAGFSGEEFLGNYGYLTATLPTAPTHKPLTGTTTAAAGKQSQIKMVH